MPEQRRFKLAITAALGASPSAPILVRGSLAGAFQQASILGYRGVELQLRDPQEIDPEEMTDLCQRYDLAIPALGSGMVAVEDHLTFSDPSEHTRRMAMKRIQEFIHLAQALNSGVIIALIFGNIGKDQSQRSGRWKAALGCLRDCCALASQYGVPLYLEPLNRYESDCLNTVEEGKAVIQEVGSPALKLLVDSYHMNIEEKGIEDSLYAARDVLGHVHLADSNREAPGRGHIDFQSILAMLRRIEYHGFLSFEILPRPDTRQALQQAIEFINNLAKL